MRQDDSRTTALGLWRFAYDYLKAAQTLDDADPNPWVPSNVTHQCACQGIELAYKSYMLASGKNLDDLRAVGHSLMKCMDAAIRLGLTAPSADHHEALEMMDRYYRGHEFRYIVTGMKEYPALGRLLSAGAAVLYDAAPVVAEAMGTPGNVRRLRLELSAALGQTPSE
jgi:hypothetical protein